MRRTINKMFFFWSGLVAIALVYTLYNIFLEDASYYGAVPRKLRHVIRFLTILGVYGIGAFALHKFAVPWMLRIWHLIYFVSIVFLLAIGLYDWSHGLSTHLVRNFADSLTELLIAPALFVTMGIINARLKK